jgi:hypothetical protein
LHLSCLLSKKRMWEKLELFSLLRGRSDDSRELEKNLNHDWGLPFLPSHQKKEEEVLSFTPSILSQEVTDIQVQYSRKEDFSCVVSFSVTIGKQVPMYMCEYAIQCPLQRKAIQHTRLLHCIVLYLWCIRWGLRVSFWFFRYSFFARKGVREEDSWTALIRESLLDSSLSCS